MKEPLFIRLYRWIFPILFPLIVLRLWRRSLKNTGYRKRILERFGFLPFVENKPVIWLHAVSLGENVAITPLVRRCISEFPDKRILVTTTTPTGSEHVRKTFGDTVLHCYLPYDASICLNQFFRQVKPQILVVAETELWPLLFEQCHHRNIPVMIVNGRISDHTFPRYQHINNVTRWMLSFVRHVAAQSVVDGERFVALGLPEERLVVMGNLKFDVSLLDYEPDVLAITRALFMPNAFIWVAASTHAGEETLILEAYRTVLAKIPKLQLIIIPRRSERFDEVADIIKQNNFLVARRSLQESCTQANQVYLADTMGDVPLFYRIADLAFVGGSLVPVGGHNALEPVMVGLPVMMGPHTQNARDVVQLLKNHGILTEVNSILELSNTVQQWLLDGPKREAMKLSTQTIIQAHQGATDKVISTLKRLL